MLPPFIIEQIRQREEEKRRDQRPVLELPLEDFAPRGWGPTVRRNHERPGPGRDVYGEPEGTEPERERAPDAERGVAIIQF